MSVVTKIYKAGQTLFTEGEPSRSIFIVKKGALSIRKKKGKAFIEVGKILSNEVLGELSFFDRQPRSATAVALMEVEVLEISFESMEKIYNSIPDYLKTIIASLADRLRKANEVIQTIQDSRS
jgi:CRP/FNR family cyclic AMP-dependent transcriptional regulator